MGIVFYGHNDLKAFLRVEEKGIISKEVKIL